MTFRAVAWDVDGTLVDSEPLHHRALLAGTLQFGVDLSDLPEDSFLGVHMGDVWQAIRSRLPPDLEEAEWLAVIIDHYIAGRATLAPLPGAVETIAALAARGIPQVCVSNSQRRIVEANLDALGVAGHIGHLITIEDVTTGKPDPEPYRMACSWLALPPAAVLAVEDSATGTLSAFRAGLPVAFCGAPHTPRVGPVLPATPLSLILSHFD